MKRVNTFPTNILLFYTQGKEENDQTENDSPASKLGSYKKAWKYEKRECAWENSFSPSHAFYSCNLVFSSSLWMLSVLLFALWLTHTTMSLSESSMHCYWRKINLVTGKERRQKERIYLLFLPPLDSPYPSHQKPSVVIFWFTTHLYLIQTRKSRCLLLVWKVDGERNMFFLRRDR